MTGALGGTAWLVDRISEEVVRLTHFRQRLLNDPDPGSHSIRTELAARIHGLRWALCLLKGWCPAYESGTGEKADGFIRVWHNLPGHCTEDGCGAWWATAPAAELRS